MSYKSENDETRDLYSAFAEQDKREDPEHENRMISFRFMSEIERLSEERGWSKKEVARRIGTSASYITQLYRGTKLLNISTLAKFQKLFGVTFEIKAVQRAAKRLNLDVGQWMASDSEPEEYV